MSTLLEMLKSAAFVAAMAAIFACGVAGSLALLCVLAPLLIVACAVVFTLAAVVIAVSVASPGALSRIATCMDGKKKEAKS